jgi:hypothetical protein
MRPDEFEIKATGHPSEPERVWTRSRLDPSKFIAEQAVARLGYARAEVVNTFGGHRSDPLFVVTPELIQDFLKT